MNPDITPIPGTPKSTSSEDSSPSSSQTSPSYDMEEEETSDDESITSTTSDRQMRPRVPISYNETVLKHLHGQPQVRTFNNLSIPLPGDSTEEDTNLEVEETDEESKQFIQTLKNYSLQDHLLAQALNNLYICLSRPCSHHNHC